MDKKDLFYKDVEEKLDDLKQGSSKKEKKTMGERFNTVFFIAIGLFILLGLLFTLIQTLGK